MVTRRQFLQGLGGLTLLSSAGYYGLHNTTEKIDLTEETIQVPGLPKAFQNYRIGFISDLHVGPFFKIELLEKSIKFLNSLSLLIKVTKVSSIIESLNLVSNSS